MVSKIIGGRGMMLGDVMDRRAFLRLIAPPKPAAPDRTSKRYIDSWVERNYMGVFEELIRYEWVTRRGLSAVDRLNDAIVGLYHTSIRFKNQSEADVYIERKLDPGRFMIRLVTIN